MKFIRTPILNEYLQSRLENFKNDMTDWTPLSLDTETNMKLRDKLETSSTSLIDMRNYLVDN